MILNYLPLPLFVLLLLAASIGVLIGVWKAWKEGYKLQAISYSMIALGGGEAIIYRIFRDLNILANDLWLIVPLAISTIGIAAVLGGISNYKIAKNDEVKKNRFMRGVYFFSGFFILLGLLGIYLFR